MKRIIGNLTAYWTFILSVMVLFLLESYAITGISKVIADYRYTGNETGGVTYMVSQAMTESMYNMVDQYLSDQEKAAYRSAYELKDDGVYYLKKDVQFEDTLKELEEDLMPAQAVAYKIMNMTETGLNALLEENELLYNDYLEIRDVIEEQIEQDPSETLKSCAWGFVRQTLSVAGRSEEDAKRGYLIRLALRFLLNLILIAAASWGASSVYSKAKRLIYLRMPDKELRSAQLMILTLTLWAGYAMILIGMCFLELGRIYSAKALLRMILILIPGLAVNYAFYKLPIFEGFCSFTYAFANTNKHGRQIFSVTFVMIPAIFTLLGLSALAGEQQAYLNLISAGCLLILVAIFFLPAVSQQVMFIEDNEKDRGSDLDWY